MLKKRFLLIVMSLVLMSISFNVRIPEVSAAPNVTIGTSPVQIILNGNDGLPWQYNLPTLSISVWGEDTANSIAATFRKTSDFSEYSGNSSAVFNHIDSATANTAKVYYDSYFNDGKTISAGSFMIQYVISNWNVKVTLENVVEASGYQLIQVSTPSLLSVRQEDGHSPWLVNGNGGGYKVDLASANTGGLPNDEGYFGSNPKATYLPVFMVGRTDYTAAVEVPGYISESVFNVSLSGSNKHATLGSNTQYRVRGGSSTPSLPVNQKDIVKITFAGDYDGSGAIDWLDGAKAVRDGMPQIPTHYYDDKMSYMIQGLYGRAAVPEASFYQMQQLNGRVANLIDNGPQVVFTAGTWNPGHDTAYPNTTVVNPKLGGVAGYNNLQTNSQNLYNTNVSVDDNYDDHYNNEFSTPYFVNSDIARNQDGSLMTFNAWNGVDTSYIAGFANYMRDGGPGITRAHNTITNYHLHDAALIDAMSWWSIRNDWNPANPASAVTNLVNGKFKVIDEYKNYGGVHVVSELMRYPFIGHLAMTVAGPNGGGGNFGGAEVPFMSLALRHSMIYGASGGNLMVDPKTVLLKNTHSSQWLSLTQSDTSITDYYYLNILPWMKLHNEDITTYTDSSGVVSMGLTNNSSVNINNNTNTWSANYNGIQIMNNYSVTVPMDSNRIAFYSQTAQTLTYPVPAGFNSSLFAAQALYSDHRSSYPLTISGGNISINVPAQVPVIVYLNGASSEKIVNDDDSKIAYNGTGWLNLNDRKLGDYNDDVHASSTSGAYAQYTFYGTGVDYVAEKNSDEGNVDVYIDNVFQTTVNNYNATRLSNATVYSKTGLSAGNHTIKVVRNSGTYLIVDAFKIYNVAVGQQLNDTQAGISYTGSGWIYDSNRGLGDYANDVHATSTSGAYFQYTFTGTGVDVYSELNSDEGTADVYIDGVLQQTIDNNRPSRISNVLVFSKTGLASGSHTVKVVNNTAGSYLILDSLKIYNN